MSKVLIVSVTADRQFNPLPFMEYAEGWHIESAGSASSYKDQKTRVTWKAEVTNAQKLIMVLAETEEHIFSWYMDEEDR